MRLASRFFCSAFLLAAAVPLASSVPACSSGGACVAGLSTTCSPLYAPTFDNVFTNTLKPSCALSGSGCHAAEGAQGGLVLSDADVAYGHLLGNHGGEVHVIPGDPSCSHMVHHLYSTEAGEQMPPGAPLPEAERCAIVQWIASGAKR